MFRSVTVLLLIITVLLGWLWQQFLTTPLVKGNQAVFVEVTKGSTVHQLAKHLKHLGFINSEQFFVFLSNWKESTHDIQAGEYEIQPGTTPSQFLDQIVAGDVMMRSITIPEGWTFNQMLAEIADNEYIVHTLAGLSPEQIMLRLGHPGENPEGHFMPETYHFAKGTSDREILRQAYLAMTKILERAWVEKDPQLFYEKPDQILIVASMIEREAKLANERPLIAGVILNRLQKNMRLQVDATVIYALGPSYQQNLTKEDLKIDSPYNTYKNKGLPPAPIALPGLASIRAAIHPVISDALYYVAKPDGSHQFSATYDEHKQAIEKYLR